MIMDEIKTSAGLKFAYAISNHIYEKGKEALKKLIEENKRMVSENSNE